MKIDVTELNMALRSLLLEANSPKELDEIAYMIKQVVNNAIDYAYERID